MLRLQSQNLVHGLDGAPDEDIELKDMVCSIGICSEISSRIRIMCSACLLTSGVPCGSLLDLLIFSDYTTPLSSLLQAYSIDYISQIYYADDRHSVIHSLIIDHLYLATKLSSWMTSNFVSS